MLHTKPQGHWPFGSGEEDFWRVFTIYGHGGHLGHVTQTQWTNFCSPIPLRLHMKFGFNTPSGFGEEDLWKWWTTDGRTDDGPWLYYKLTNEPKGSGELIRTQGIFMRTVKTLIRLGRCPCWSESLLGAQSIYGFIRHWLNYQIVILSWGFPLHSIVFKHRVHDKHRNPNS